MPSVFSPPTRAQIAAEIERLLALHLALRRHPGVEASIKAQVDVLEILSAAKPGVLCEDDLAGIVGDEDQVLSSAIDAYRWASGESEEAPSAGWKPLLQP